MKRWWLRGRHDFRTPQFPRTAGSQVFQTKPRNLDNQGEQKPLEQRYRKHRDSTRCSLILEIGLPCVSIPVYLVYLVADDYPCNVETCQSAGCEGSNFDAFMLKQPRKSFTSHWGGDLFNADLRKFPLMGDCLHAVCLSPFFHYLNLHSIKGNFSLGLLHTRGFKAALGRFKVWISLTMEVCIIECRRKSEV